MNYHQYPVPVWTTPEKWLYTIQKYPWKIETIIRDNYKCRDCNVGSEKLIVHHIDLTGKKENENNSINNLVTLCKKCHANRHGYTKTKKTEKIIELLNQYSDGNKSLIHGANTEIAKKIGLSRERVRQISNKLGFVTYQNDENTFKKKYCAYCNKEITLNRSSKYCSVDCQKDHHFYKYNVLLKCKNCNFYFISPRGRFLTHGRDFCSKVCFGQYAGKNFGFIANPQNATGSQPRYSFDDLKVYFKEDFTLDEFAKHFKYRSIVGAKNAIKSLILQDKIEEYRIKGLYRIKKNPLLT